jgi:hypothetical protein
MGRPVFLLGPRMALLALALVAADWTLSRS